MGLALPQVITEDRASGAQFIDGSLKFDSTKIEYLSQTFGDNGNRKTFTFSFWTKRSGEIGQYPGIIQVGANSSINGNLQVYFDTDDLVIYCYSVGTIRTSAKLRDVSGWYHIVIGVDTTPQPTNGDKIKLYINGVRQTDFSSYPTINDNVEFLVNSSGQNIDFGGIRNSSGTLNLPYAGYISQFYFIDGQQVEAEEFGFTDPLTNTWRPKKYTGNFNIFPDIDLASTGSGEAIEVVINRQVDKAWIKNHGSSVYEGGGNPSDPSSAPSFHLPSGGSLYWFTTAYDSAHTMVIGSSSETGTQPEWATGGTTGSLSRDSATIVSGTPSSTYSSARTDALADNTVYAFTYTITTGSSGNHTGWFLSTSSSYSSGTPDEQTSGNTVGARFNGGGDAYYGFLAVYGSFASINPNTYISSYPRLSNRGINSFYLPFDGNSPIGQDKSGKGNNFTPVNFGGSAGLDQATGALPILNTNGGGNVAGVGVRTDSHAANLVLALPLVGSKDDVSGQINSGSTSKAITLSGGSGASSAQSNFYGGSFVFNGSSDNLTTPASSDFDFGTGSYTIEWWQWWNSNSGYQSVYACGYTGANTLLIQSNTGTSTYVVYADGAVQISETTNAPMQEWVHYALVRDADNGNTITLFRNGVVSYTGTASGAGGTAGNHGNSVSAPTFGSDYTYYFNGYLSDYRVYKGVAKYTNNFIVPATKPDILPDTPSGVSGSSKLAKITEGAVHFDGTGDYLDIPWSSDFDLGTDSDFTIEFFVNFQDDATTSTILSWGADTNNRFDIGCQSANTLRMFGVSGGTTIINGTAPISPKRWHHIVVIGYSDVQNGSGTSAVVLFVDGERKFANIGALDTYAMPTDTSNGIDIGRRRYGTTVSDYFGGYISNLRIVKGSAIYPYSIDGVTQNSLTVPTSKLTAITNTKLLCCQSNTSAGAAAVSPNIGGINGGTVWSDYLEPSFGIVNPTQPTSNVFDASLTSFSEPATGGAKFIWTPPNDILLTQDLEFVLVGATYDWRIGSTTLSQITGSGSGNNWVALTGSSGLTIGPNSPLVLDSSNTNWWYVYGIKVNGEQLLDPVKRNGNSAATNFNPFSTDINTVRGQETNYATWNTLTDTGVVTTTNGGLVAKTTESSYGWTVSTIPLSSGKYYCEINFEGEMYHSTNFNYIGIVPASIVGQFRNLDIFRGLGALAIESNGTSKIRASLGTGGGDTQSDWNTSMKFDETSTIGIAIDCDTPQVKFYVDGLDVGTFPYAMQANESWVVFCNDWAAGYQDFEKYILNAGQKPFKFPPPDGFQPMNAANTLLENVIARPDQFVGVTTYIGNGADRRIETGMKPDMVWIKSRNHATWHQINDTVRGAGKRLFPNDVSAEDTATDNLTGFYDRGFLLGADANASGTNVNLKTYVAWSWKAGGNKNTFNVDDVGYANASDIGMNVGGQNSNIYDQSANWSASCTLEQSYRVVSEAFDGSLATYADSGITNTYRTITTSSFTVNSSLRVYCPNGSGPTLTWRINNGEYGPYTGVAGWNTIPFTGTVNNFEAKTNTSSAQVAAVEVDGKILVNNNLTPANVPSIAPTGASVGTRQGFSIVKYTGNATINSTLPHGLLEAPKFVIIKNLTSGYGWLVLHTSAGFTGTMVDGSPEYYMLLLESSAARQDYSTDTIWNPTSTSVKIAQTNGANWVNANNSQYIMYSWHDVPGLQKFGKYVGNNSADGPVIELGFKPKLIICKGIDDAEDWYIRDTERSPYNPVDNPLRQDSGTEYSGRDIDILSNGFKLTTADNQVNEAGKSYLYCAWAEVPTVNLYGGQSNAR